MPKNWCATNGDCRLADWQVSKVNIVVKCSNRFPIFKTSLSEDLKFRDGESVRAFHNCDVYHIYLPVCKSAVCECHTPVKNVARIAKCHSQLIDNCFLKNTC